MILVFLILADVGLHQTTEPCLCTVWSSSVSDIHLGNLLNMNHLLLITLSSSAHRYETTANYVDCDVLITDDKVVNVKYNTTNCIFCAVFLVDFSFLDVFFFFNRAFKVFL